MQLLERGPVRGSEASVALTETDSGPGVTRMVGGRGKELSKVDTQVHIP